MRMQTRKRGHAERIAYAVEIRDRETLDAQSRLRRAWASREAKPSVSLRAQSISWNMPILTGDRLTEWVLKARHHHPKGGFVAQPRRPFESRVRIFRLCCRTRPRLPSKIYGQIRQAKAVCTPATRSAFGQRQHRGCAKSARHACPLAYSRRRMVRGWLGVAHDLAEVNQ